MLVYKNVVEQLTGIYVASLVIGLSFRQLFT